MTYLILHGLEGSGPHHWQTWLAEQLRAEGKTEVYPQFSDPYHPQRDVWLAELDAAIKNIDDNFCVIGHSLAGPLWLHYVAGHPGVRSTKVILVSPAPDDCGVEQIKNFFPLPHELTGVDVSSYLVVGSDNDPYITFDKFHTFCQKYHIEFQLVPGAGHINTASGFWPLIKELLSV